MPFPRLYDINPHAWVPPYCLSNNRLQYFTFPVIFLPVFFLIVISWWTFTDSKSPQVSRTFLSILANLNNAVVWLVSVLPLPFQVHQLQLVSLSLSCSIAFSVLWQGPSIFLSFSFFFFFFFPPLCCPLEQQNPTDDKFSLRQILVYTYTS